MWYAGMPQVAMDLVFHKKLAPGANLVKLEHDWARPSSKERDNL